jgi:hypothetical protein
MQIFALDIGVMFAVSSNGGKTSTMSAPFGKSRLSNPLSNCCGSVVVEPPAPAGGVPVSGAETGSSKKVSKD